MSENITTGDFSLFMDTMLDENQLLQIEAVDNIEHLAKALGEQVTRKELLPFIERNLDLHEEALVNLSEHLQGFVSLVGGLEYSQIIFDILAKLCYIDEIAVREKAIEALINIAQEFNQSQTEQFLLPVLNKLIKDEWFTSKCSAVMMYPTCYAKLGDDKKADLRHNFKMLIQDDSPMVRKAAAVTLMDFIDVVEDDVVRHEFVPIFCDIALDPMDYIRLVSIKIALSLAKRLSESALNDSIFKTIETMSDDSSWNIRQCLADNIAEFQRYIPYDKYRGKLIALLQKLSQDVDLDVRILIGKNIYDFCRYLLDSYLKKPISQNNFEPVFEQSIMTVIQKLANDEYEDVRLSLSSNILALSNIMSEECFKRNLVPLLLDVLNKEDCIAVQANFLQGLNLISSKVDLTTALDAIRAAIKAVLMRSQTNWRSRRSVLMTFMDIAKFCTADSFCEQYKIFFASLLGDAVFAVRRNASLILPLLAKHYGIKWASENLVPHFMSFYADWKYLYRFIPLFGMSEMISPFLCRKPVTYLGELRAMMDNKKAVLSLARIVKTVKIIEANLQEEKFRKILSLKCELDYLSTCHMNTYLEDGFREITIKYNTINVYSVEEKDFENNNFPYLQGIMQLINDKFLPALEILNNDPTVNVQIRAICTLSEISDFIAKLSKEASESWVEESLKALTHEELENINDELKSKSENKKVETEPEQLDTTLDENYEEVEDSKKVKNNNDESIKENASEKNKAEAKSKDESSREAALKVTTIEEENCQFSYRPILGENIPIYDDLVRFEE